MAWYRSKYFTRTSLKTANNHLKILWNINKRNKTLFFQQLGRLRTGTQEFATSSNHFCWTTKLQVGLVVAIFKVTLGSLYKNYQVTVRVTMGSLYKNYQVTVLNIDTFLTFILRVLFSCLFIFPKRIFPFLLVWEIYFRCIFSFHNLTLFFFGYNITFHIFQNILFSVNCLPLTIVEMFHLSVRKFFYFV